MDAALPDFDNPPITEVALSVQFEALTSLRTPQIGLLWQVFRQDFPQLEEHAPLDPRVERFGVKGDSAGGVRLEMVQQPPMPRCWFLNTEGTELIQVQKDRFGHNWRTVSGEDPYPRYDRLRKTFKEELRRFDEFLKEEKLGDLSPTQCDVTYVDHIVAGEGWSNHGELGRVLALFNCDYGKEFLPELEEAHARGSYVIPGSDGQPAGRLHFSIKPVYRRSDGAAMFVLDLVARGQPAGEGMEGVFQFLDIGHEWIVRGFADITTEKMHKVWGRRDER